MAEFVDFTQTEQGTLAYLKMTQEKKEAEKRYNLAKEIYEKRQNKIKCFGNRLSEVMKQKCLEKGRLCVSCHGLQGTYDKRIMVDGQPYCDEHGKWMLEKHREMHPDSDDNCVACAVLDCPFFREDHYEKTGDAEGCPECYDHYF
jgi:hypothetical protein